MITTRLNEIATGLQRAVRSQGSEYRCEDCIDDDCCEGFLSSGSEQRLLAIVEPRDNETEEDYRKRVVDEIHDVVSRVLQPCPQYLEVLRDEVKTADHLIARKLYEAYKKRKLDQIPAGDSYARRDWDQVWKQYDGLLLGDA